MDFWHGLGQLKQKLSTTLSATTAAFFESNPRTVYVVSNADGSLVALPVIMFDAKTNTPLQVESATQPNLRTSIFNGSNEFNFRLNDLGLDGQSAGSSAGLASFLFAFNGASFDRMTYPTAMANASAAGAASTQLVAAGGASKKYRLWGIALSAVATAAATDGVVTVNEVTSGTVLLSLRVSATSAAAESTAISFFGMPQPTANNAIQVTSIANVTADATLIYTAAY